MLIANSYGTQVLSIQHLKGLLKRNTFFFVVVLTAKSYSSLYLLVQQDCQGDTRTNPNTVNHSLLQTRWKGGLNYQAGS